MSRLTKLRAFKWPAIAWEVQKNVRSRARGRRGGLQAITAVGASLEEPARRLAYSRNVFEAYVAHAQLDAGRLDGIRVLELGPGEDLSVALRFLAAGAATVSCVDRFVFDVEPAWEHEVYRLLLDELDGEGRRRLSELVTPDGDLRRDDPRLEIVGGIGIEEAVDHLRGGDYDLIVSVAVLEHVYDVAASMRAMDALLAPGGVMVHQVDLRDHGMFSAGGRHPLEFLTIPDGLYRVMTSHTGAPNRERLSTYRGLLDGLGHESQIKVTNVGGAREALDPYRERIAVGGEVDRSLADSIEGMRGRLPARFRSLPVEELAATGIVFRSRKPG
jgi:SAM-dependent methyltransferase